MKIFISWSGELSHNVAKDLKEWLSCVLQGVDAFVSSEDIRKGQRWGFEVAKELNESNFGILCLTKDNLTAPWILFEAGALSKFVNESNVSAFLIDGIEMSDIKPPLSQFQNTRYSKEDVQKLIMTINDKLGEKSLPNDTVKKVFEKWYPDLEDKIRLSIQNVGNEMPAFEKRSDREIIVETLELARFLASRSLDFSDFKNVIETRHLIRTEDGVLLSPRGGEFNHPTEVKIYPVPINDNGKKKLVSVTISGNGVETTEIHPPFQTRGVIIKIKFFSETESQYWETYFQFHKGNTLVDTQNIEEIVSNVDGELYEWGNAIWRD